MAGAPITPDELTRAFAPDMPSEVKLMARMPGATYVKFSKTEMQLAQMLEDGWITAECYQKLHQRRDSYKFMDPIEAGPDLIKTLSETNNPNAIMFMLSQTAGAQRQGDKVVPIRKEDIPGMDTRSVEEILREPLVQRNLTFRGGMQMLELLAKKKESEGSADDKETTDLIRTGKKFFGLLQAVMPGMMEKPNVKDNASGQLDLQRRAVDRALTNPQRYQYHAPLEQASQGLPLQRKPAASMRGKAPGLKVLPDGTRVYSYDDGEVLHVDSEGNVIHRENTRKPLTAQ